MRDSYGDFDQAQAETAWRFLSEGISKIYEKQSCTLSYEELYRNAYSLVLHRYGDMAYRNLSQALDENMLKYFQKLNSLQDEDFLVHLQNIWFEAKFMIKIIKNIFLYMDKNYVPLKDASIKPVLILGYETFKKIFLNKERQLFDKFQREILKIIKSERDGFHIDRILVKNLLHMLIELGTQAVRVKPNTVYGYSSYARENPTMKEVPSKEIYKICFEAAFIADTKKYYDAEAQHAIRSMTCSEYLVQAERRLREEKDRLEFYLDLCTETGLISTFVHSYIIQNCKTLIEMENSGLYFLLQEEKSEQIKRMFRLFLPSDDSFELFLEAFNTYLNNNLERLIADEEVKKDPLKMIENLVEFHSKIDRVFKSSLNIGTKHQSFTKVIKNTFETWMNKHQYVNYNLNAYLDNCLKKTFISKSETEVEQSLNKIMELFKFIQDKDIFEKFYKNFLSKRLLEDRSLSEEYEKLMIEKLRRECGPFYTSKLEIMFKDITISKQLMLDFQSKTQRTSSPSPGVEIQIRMLTQSSWPVSEVVSCVLPPELKSYIFSYEKFYLGHNPGKNLTWATNYGSGLVRAEFKERKKEFVMNTHQICISLIFNERNKATVSELQTLLQIPLEELKTCLEPLIGIKLFSKESSEEEFRPKDVIVFNEAFSHKSYRVTVPGRKRKAWNMERNTEDGLIEAVQVERKHTIEAAVVRIMKARKMMEHSQLVEEVIKYAALSQFIPDAQFIKQIFESLINREYLDRSPTNKNVYIYLS